MKKIYKIKPIISITLLLLLGSSCKKFVDVDPPITKVTSISVFSSDATAIAVMTGVYANLSSSSAASNFITGSNGISYLSGLSADDFTLWSGITGGAPLNYFRNSLANNTNGFEFWNNIYVYVFRINSAIEGLYASSGLTPAIKQQLLGEAKFMRAFCYFYLVNLYGDVPLILTSDYTANASFSRNPKAQIYQQIIADLKDAQSLLSVTYLDATLLKVTTERVRPTQTAATALLARAYLYNGDLTHEASNYSNAETQATSVINNTGYGLTALISTFLKNSNEAIWQLQPINSLQNTADAGLFLLTSSGPNSSSPVYLNTNLLNSFEIGDLRAKPKNWIDTIRVPAITGTLYYFPFKYKSYAIPNTTPATPVSEYLMVLRLGEQYLIRAEARAQLGTNLTGSAADLNMIRIRAGLPNTTASTQTSLLTAILHERQVELFSEWGHRWLDLKRTGTVDAVMSIVTPIKGGVWNPNWALYPLPLGDLQKDPNLVQNAGY